MGYGQQRGPSPPTAASQSPRIPPVGGQQKVLEQQQLQRQMVAIQERRALMDHPQQQSFEAGMPRSVVANDHPSLSPGVSKRGAPPMNSAILPSPTSSLNPGEAHARQRKAVIRALLEEEQEWEMKRRAGMAVDQPQYYLQQKPGFDHRPALPGGEAFAQDRGPQLQRLEQLKLQQQHQQQRMMQQQQQIMIPMQRYS
jgi:hypothetical protein